MTSRNVLVAACLTASFALVLGGDAAARGSGPAGGAAGRGTGLTGGRAGGGGRAGTVQGLPLINPPYDQITAYNMNTGDLVWQKTHSSTPATSGITRRSRG